MLVPRSRGRGLTAFESITARTTGSFSKMLINSFCLSDGIVRPRRDLVFFLIKNTATPPAREVRIHTATHSNSKCSPSSIPIRIDPTASKIGFSSIYDSERQVAAMKRPKTAALSSIKTATPTACTVKPDPCSDWFTNAYSYPLDPDRSWRSPKMTYLWL